ncbi:unnamed protein product [Tetraodon nigroviridis]|uniref:(spotted green pufferfish) hypothetical protein n=1 Tax=Tetraodon nigroviridis TaxID=99883 RepID=Q4SIZ3_TETNG|nr:unnamed protein product [Tetraodon nigroviridis]
MPRRKQQAPRRSSESTAEVDRCEAMLCWTQNSPVTRFGFWAWACTRPTLSAAPHAAKVSFLKGTEQERRSTSGPECTCAAEI